MALFLIAASVGGLAVTADRSQRSALSGYWTSYPVGQPIPKLRCTVTTSGAGTTIACPSRTAGRASESGVDILGSGPATVAVGGRVLCVRRLAGQVFISTGHCLPG